MPQPARPKAPRPTVPLAVPATANDPLPAYAELHCRSNFSFLTGASHPQELVARAAQLGYRAIAITDECSVAGVVRAHEEAKRQAEAGNPLQLIVGSEFTLQGEGDEPGCRLVLLAHDREGYGNLCELITRTRLRSEKGSYHATLRDVDSGALAGLPHCSALLVPRREDPPETLLAQARWLAATFGPERAAIAVELLMYADDSLLVERLEGVAAQASLPLAAAGDVLMHVRSRKAVQDTLTAIRLKTPVADCGYALARNAEQHLRSRLRLAQLYRAEWLANAVVIAARCNFSLDDLRYEYPTELVPAGHDAKSWLRVLTEEGAAKHYPAGIPAPIRVCIEKELGLIEELKYEAFFLTVHDIVRFARDEGILCQGRGSAANSVVCYCLGITAVRPEDSHPLFERFISRERREPPDIDVDFEHERRDEVMKYIYDKYGTERTALAAALSTYRSRGAVRDVGKALDIDEGMIDALAKGIHWFDEEEGQEQKQDRLQRGLSEIGLDLDSPVTHRWLDLVRAVRGFPRHLSQHVGGFVIARDKLSRLVPIENAAMADRRVIQWDKDDLESLGLLKVDVLALGMLTALRRALVLQQQWRGGRRWELHDIPADDPATYDMICAADTVGVFQIESRAQMSMLPRLQPRKFYDLVIEVAIVRPGPIEGGMVHPYLNNRRLDKAGQLPPPRYPALHEVLRRTLGIPIFQEQVMQICVVAAGFTPGQSDGLRRAMAAWKRHGDVGPFRQPILDGMRANGYDQAFAEALFEQIKGFGSYGFPESHAYSFAILAYASAWIKCHEPAIFLAALLNSQPMGFYAPSQLVQGARRHGVEVRAADVTASDWDCTLEKRTDGGEQPAVRLGLRLVSGLSKEAAERMVAARGVRTFASVDDLARRADLDARELQMLAHADALQTLAGHRRRQLWAAAGQGRPEKALLVDAPIVESAHEQPDLFEAPEGEAIALDYASTGLTLRRHPLALLRDKLARRGWKSAQQLGMLKDGASAWACGIVTMRQQPETAKGVIFVTLEDETGSVNVIVWKRVRDRQRPALLRSRLLAVAGKWQSKDGVSHLVARHLADVTPLLGAVATSSRDFH